MRLSIVPTAGATASRSARRRTIALVIVGGLLIVVAFAIARAVIHPERRSSSNDAAQSPVATDPSQPAEPVTQAVNAFSAFTLEQSAARGPDFNERYAIEGLRLLATVVDAFIVRDSLVRHVHAATPGQLRAEAARLELASGLPNRVTPTRAAFVAAAEIVTVVQRRNYPHLEHAIARLRDAARSIRLNRPLSDQSAEIESFFQRANDAVQGMTAVRS